MTNRRIARSILGSIVTAMVAFPIGTAWGTAHAASSTTKKYTGPAEVMMWGQVRVSIYVKGNKIKTVKATAPTERTRSAIINEQALPLLKQEVLHAQSARIDVISGATMTSDAYILSLKAAIKKAHLKKPAATATPTPTSG
ncbi:MAG TPA: FMN-binding protein [Chloroflexota bacterium]|nr:FMN-binding protein [Chloroflexota bacterium]